MISDLLETALAAKRARDAVPEDADPFGFLADEAAEFEQAFAFHWSPTRGLALLKVLDMLAKAADKAMVHGTCHICEHELAVALCAYADLCGEA